MCQVSDFDKLQLTDRHRTWVRNELAEWHKDYLPVHGTVLDIGAGCGETALFYLAHGAERVVCVEGDREALECLQKNFGDDPRVLIVPALLNSVKMDVDGAEENMVLETHFPVEFRQVWQDGMSDTRLWRIVKK